MENLAFDIDGTLADVTTPLRQHMWRDWHVDIDDIGISRHDFFEQICQPGYFEPFLDYFFSIIDQHWMGIEPYEGASEIYKFSPVLFITARRTDLIAATHDWLIYNFPKLKFTILQARSKDKVKLLHELQLDGIVEDRLRTANEVAESGLVCYLLNRSWNLGRPIHHRVIRINSLKEIPHGR